MKKSCNHNPDCFTCYCSHNGRDILVSEIKTAENKGTTGSF